MSTIYVRRHKSSDLVAMMRVRRTAILRVNSRDYTTDQVKAWAGDKDNLDAQATRFEKTLTWVAEINGVIVGYTNLGSDGYLDCLYVHADHQRCGVASSLFRALETVAIKEGVTRLHSEVSITARPFFERQGFRIVMPQRVALRGQEYDNFVMEKMLANTPAPKAI